MRKAKRRRNIAVTFRMNEGEYAEFQKKLEASGLSKQAYVIGAVCGASVTSADELAALREVSATLADYERQVRGIGTNVNQMARVANGQGVLPSEAVLERLSDQIEDVRREGESLWLSIRSSIARQSHAGR
ncbi:MAG: plasmid mobilization relaxosome protein MobC [Lachnospiraceae bacterium]|jgi:hypothetical protein|nr:plasmid mobilization relaxosome protein MobC [Lachnospiraceae bacterium]MBR3507771.1 plasmid mobilization relaxosome protein MobC [Lachnospiraceae bacterium]MBR4606048.1 plasmid mobilization relaxosome protein MobC [Lachnospiraceae bacterium]MBR6152449.1 plasmid mobilization relaxosome protein MobC [Lachnospiraceae bacterium]